MRNICNLANVSFASTDNFCSCFLGIIMVIFYHNIKKMTGLIQQPIFQLLLAQYMFSLSFIVHLACSCSDQWMTTLPCRALKRACDTSHEKLTGRYPDPTNLHQWSNGKVWSDKNCCDPATEKKHAGTAEEKEVPVVSKKKTAKPLIAVGKAVLLCAMVTARRK